MKKSLLWVLLGLLPATSALANPGYYVQGEAGYTVISANVDSGAEGLFGDLFNNADPAGASGRLSGGYLWGDNNFNYGLEAGLLYYPNADDSQSYSIGDSTYRGKVEYSGYNLDLLGVLKYTFDSGFAVFAKAGGAFVSQTLKVFYANPGQSLTQTSDTSGTKFAPEVAAGIGYQFTPEWEMDITGSRVFAGDGPSSFRVTSNGGFASTSDPVAETSTIALGLTYHFA